MAVPWTYDGWTDVGCPVTRVSVRLGGGRLRAPGVLRLLAPSLLGIGPQARPTWRSSGESSGRPDGRKMSPISARIVGQTMTTPRLWRALCSLQTRIAHPIQARTSSSPITTPTAGPGGFRRPFGSSFDADPLLQLRQGGVQGGSLLARDALAPLPDHPRGRLRARDAPVQRALWTVPRLESSCSKPRFRNLGVAAIQREPCRRRHPLPAPCRELTCQARTLPGGKTPLAILWLRRPRQKPEVRSKDRQPGADTDWTPGESPSPDLYDLTT